MSNNNSIVPVFTGIQQRIVEELSSAKDSIYIAVAWFTDPEILELLKNKVSDGLDINIIVDNNEANLDYASLKYKELRQLGIEIDLIGKNVEFGRQMHNKFCVIDWETVITGSYNWSKNAQTNEENVVIIKDAKTAKGYLNEFDRIKETYCREHGRIERFQKWIERKIYQIRKGQPPIISTFKSNSNFLSLDEKVVFSWEIKNDYTNVFLNNIEVTGKKKYVVSDGNTDTFRLKVINTEHKEYRGILEATSQPIYIEVDTTPANIVEFYSDKNIVRNKENVMLSWQVEQAVKIELLGYGEMVENHFEIQPNRDVTYTLRAFAFNGEITESEIFVEVDKSPPLINFFNTDRRFVNDKKPVLLNWDVEDSDEIHISQTGTFYDSIGECEVYPKRDTKYILTAISFYGVEATREANIEVSKTPPDILRFYPDKYTLTDAVPAKLKWTIEGAESITIDNSVGDVTQKEFIAVHNMVDTVYTLTAVSYFGVPSKKRIKISINKTPPTINYLRSDKEYILADYTARISWSVENSYSTNLNPIGNVNAEGESLINIQKDTCITLVAANYFGYKSSANLHLKILPIPLIEKLLVPDIDVRMTTQLEHSSAIKNIDLKINSLNSNEFVEIQNGFFSKDGSNSISYLGNKISIAGFAAYLKKERNKLFDLIKIQFKEK